MNVECRHEFCISQEVCDTLVLRALVIRPGLCEVGAEVVERCVNCCDVVGEEASDDGSKAMKVREWK